ncbi:zinc finger CCCH domain-containing protein 11A-like [Myxocyprinus asiaticus]|uniref:zinc finger CCCH domain-containing protein 11A-like n=1 Tax=Myxocyprinus asiaticus TaxID=70543 RepID=UPI002222C974|nr:zinc finger CCCH domain-containing protein 11A-like [Myxocyprinus asiaticus]XP_051531952.1 zinc finger CCCH domain-containing protein 11A-like [Myxocyprinus asiaticus]
MQGNDCYFYYYSTCSKGDSCPFRHCEAAIGSETVCTLWQEQMCFRKICKFRHMEIKKNRKEIPCYWENQPEGCQKPHCAFHHVKSRIIDGNCFPPDEGQVVQKEKDDVPHEDQVIQLSSPFAPPTNPQLRGVIRNETQENVPSPTHPPVVINPVDDDDDEDDQFAEEGDESLGGSPRKLITNDSLNFGIQTLEEIRLRKALLANLKMTGQSTLQGADQSKGTAVETEKIRSLPRPEMNNAKIDSSVNEIGKRKITDRLGKRIFGRDVPMEGEIPLKRSLAERLCGVVGSSAEHADTPPQNTQKPVRERLGLTTDLATSGMETKSSGDIRIKSLKEIRQEKAARTVKASKVVHVVKEVPSKESSPSKKTAGGPQVKTFSEILHEKKKLQKEKAQEVNAAARSPERNEGPSTVAAGVVRVKTLEEIRREKAARMQAQLKETTNDKATASSEPSGAPKRRILRINKTSPAANKVSQTKLDASDKKLEPATEANGKGDNSGETVKVKSFEEIMREKRLRKQQEEQGTSTIQKEAGPAAPAASPPASEPSTQPQTSVGHRITLKPKTPPVPAAVVPQQSSPKQSGESAPSSKTLMPSTPAIIPVQLTEGTIQTLETKVKPKVNVKPSVMKPAYQPELKRKASKVHHSAVAEVKPHNTAHQTPSLLDIPNKWLKVASPNHVTDVQSDTQQVPSNTEDVKTVPTLEPSSTTSTASETVAVPKSPVIRTPSLQLSRRSSTAARTPAAVAVSSSSVDDFEDLLDEFTDDRLEDDLELDPGKGEDDLLLELSEMIDN